MGIRRFEIGNALHGLEMKIGSPWSVTLHVSEVYVAVSREPWQDDGMTWHHPTVPAALIHRDNALFYRNETIPSNLPDLRIDRIVRAIDS
jgi:hypothetical protein